MVPASSPCFMRRLFRVPRKEMVYLKFVLESYDGLAVMSTVDAREGIISISFPASSARDLDDLVMALREEIPLADVPAEEIEPADA